jgi:hypothetical protein
MIHFIQNIKNTLLSDNLRTGQYSWSKIMNFTLCALIFSITTMALPACKTKSGCPTTQFTNSMEKNTKGGNSQLFPKKMRKKMKKS